MSTVDTDEKTSIVQLRQRRARRILTNRATYVDKFIPDLAEAVEFIKLLQSMEVKIGVTFGVFDLWHQGHGDYIQAGKDSLKKEFPGAEQYIMVVGVDSDEVVKLRKGPSRPIVPMEERCRILAHMGAVDIIVPQTEENQLYRLLPYDARVISTSTGDLPNREEIEKYCSHIICLPPQAETSTTARIRQLAVEGKNKTLQRVKEGLEKLLEEINDDES